MATGPDPALLFVSSIRVPDEGDPTAAKKWKGLAERFRVHVVCFSTEGFTRRTRFNTRFYGLPAGLWFPLRALVYYLLVPWLALYVTLRYGVRTWVAQGPYEAASVVFVKYLLKPFLRLRLIVEAHGDWIDSFLHLRTVPFPGLVKSLLKTVSPLLLYPADGLRSVSDRTRTMLNEYTGSERPHLTFPGFTDLDVFLETTLPEKKKREENYVLYVGAFTDLKGLPDLLEATRRAVLEVPELTLKLYGYGEGKHYRQRARDLDIETTVEFHEPIPQTELRKKYVGARCLVLPSRTEGLPRVLLESLACFTPFVATRTPGSREVQQSSGGGVVVPIGDPRRLAEAMVDLYRSPSERRSRGNRGRDYVETNFSTERFFDGYEKLLTFVHSDDSTGG